MHTASVWRPLAPEVSQVLAELFGAVEEVDGTDEHWSSGKLIGYAKAMGLPDATDVHLI
ncbi:hypothetical protein ABZS94_28670 [Streptomyces sp. NPDC005500]|uniref:hypothetical protein n=1 Tax=Streptomyces sp. NPDC005500 TaxID=3155007 RepID=UPI0033AB344C